MKSILADGHLRQWWRDVGPGFNRAVLNPVMLQFAGKRFWYAARLEHVGRRSGRHYATPVVARRVRGGYAIPLPYGTDVDWARNIQAAGDAVLVVGGSRHAVTAPEVVAFSEIADDLPRGVRETYRLMVNGPWLRLTEVEATTQVVAPTTVVPE